MIVALDGPDGAGKSTLVSHLIRWAHARGRSARVVDKWEIFDSALVRSARFLRGTDREELRLCIAEMPSPARMMFLAWMNTLAAGRALGEAAEDLVVVDGYWVKHAASELILGGDPGLVEAIGEAIAPVDLIVYVDVDPDEALRRKQGLVTAYECGADLTCDPHRFLAHQAGMRTVMLEWARTRGWAVLAADAPTIMSRRLTDLVLTGLVPADLVPTDLVPTDLVPGPGRR